MERTALGLSFRGRAGRDETSTQPHMVEAKLKLRASAMEQELLQDGLPSVRLERCWLASDKATQKPSSTASTFADLDRSGD
jgi:hypothetical protein